MADFEMPEHFIRDKAKHYRQQRYQQNDDGTWGPERVTDTGRELGPTVENADGWAIPMGSQVASLHEATEEENLEADAWLDQDDLA